MTMKCKWMLHGGKKRRFYVLDLGDGVELTTDPWQDGPVAYRAMRGLVRMEKVLARAKVLLRQCELESDGGPTYRSVRAFLDKEWNGR